MIGQDVAFIVLVVVTWLIGFLVGRADRKWWRGPKPSDLSDKAPTPTPLVRGMIYDTDEDFERIADRLLFALDRPSPHTGISLRGIIEGAIDKRMPTEEQFRTTVAHLVTSAIDTVQKLQAKPTAAKKRRRT